MYINLVLVVLFIVHAKADDDCLPSVPFGFGCTKAKESFTDPKNCSQYIICQMEHREDCGPKYLGYKVMSCPESTLYNEEEAECQNIAVCPTDPSQTLNPNVICTEEDQTFEDPADCKAYKICRKYGSNWYLESGRCRANKYYSIDEEDCVEGTCPGCFPYADDVCKQGNRIGDTEDCTKYYTCVPNKKNCQAGTWGKEHMSCPPGTFFDVIDEWCNDVNECPQYCPERVENQTLCYVEGLPLETTNCPGEGVCTWNQVCNENSYVGYWAVRCAQIDTTVLNANDLCTAEGDSFGSEASCTSYVSCEKNDDGWTWSAPKSCNVWTSYFDQESRTCKRGLCPGCMRSAPQFSECKELLDRYANDDDCTSFFYCERNEDRCETGLFVGELEKCKNGQFYDSTAKKCVSVPECPQICPDRVDNVCYAIGDTVESQSCPSGKAVCIWVDTCPDEGYQLYAYWSTVCIPAA